MQCSGRTGTLTLTRMAAAITAGCDAALGSSPSWIDSTEQRPPTELLVLVRRASSAYLAQSSVGGDVRDVVVTVGVMLGMMAGASAVGADSAATAESAFSTQITQYMALRRQVEQRVPGPRASDDRAGIDSAADALAEAIRAARPRATPGDIFSPRIAADFRQIIETVSREQQLAVNLPDPRPRVSREPALPPIVNARFDWNLDAVMPPFLIRALPPLPTELQYRLVGCDLVLVDIVARLVIDILPAALGSACDPRDRR